MSYIDEIRELEMDDDLVFSIMEDPEFKSDGCSGGLSYLWKKLFKKEIPYQYMCLLHDIHFYYYTKKRNSFKKELKQKLSSDYILINSIWNMNKNWYDKPMAILVAAGLETFGNFNYSWKLIKNKLKK